MRDYVAIGAVPGDEDCASVGCDNYTAIAREESRKYAKMLTERFQNAPRSMFKIDYFFKDEKYWVDAPTLGIAKALCETLANQVGYAEVTSGNNLVYLCKVEKTRVTGH